MASPRPPTFLEAFRGRTATTGGPQPAQQEAQRAREARGATTLAEVTEGQIPEPGNPALAAEVAGSVVGGGLGGLAGRTVLRSARPLLRRAAEALGSVGGGTAGSLAGSELSAATEETPEEARRRRARAALGGAFGEVLGLGFQAGTRPLARATVRGLRQVPGVRRALGPADRSLEKGAREAQEILVPRGQSLTAGQALKSRTVDVLEGVAEGSLVGGGLITSARERAGEAAEAALEETLERFGARASKEEMGSLLSEALEGSAAIHMGLVQDAYAAVDDALRVSLRDSAGNAVPAARIDLRAVKEEARQRLRLRARGKTKSARAARTMLDTLKGVEDTVGFEEASTVRSILLEINREEKGLSKGVKSLAGRYARLVDEAMESGASGLSGNPLGAWRTANALSRFGKETFNDRVIANMVSKSSPEEVWQVLLRNDRPTTVKRVHRILFDPRFSDAIPGGPESFWQQIQGNFLREQTLKAGADEFSELSGAKLMQRIRGSGETFQAIFPEESAQQSIRRVARTLQLNQGAAGAAPGRMAIMLTQGSMIMGLVGLGVAGSAGVGPGVGLNRETGVILLGPAAMAVALSRPAVADLLIRGVKGDFAGRRAASLMGQLVSRLREDSIPFEILGRDPDSPTPGRTSGLGGP